MDSNKPDEQLITHTRTALENLYDFPFLENHPFVHELPLKDRRPGESGGQHLRRELMGLIESLNPGKDVHFRSPNARLYSLLHLHYIEGMIIKDAAQELGLSLRQAYRDLERGVENIASFFWTRRQKKSAGLGDSPSEETVENEFLRLGMKIESVDFLALLDNALAAVQRLAALKSVILLRDPVEGDLSFATDRVLAQQTLIMLLSQVIQRAQPGPVTCALSLKNSGVVLRVQFFAQPPGASLVLTPITPQLLKKLNWKANFSAGAEGSQEIHLVMTNSTSLVLIIDDNEGLANLITRYLSDTRSRVIAFQNPSEALARAPELAPDVILLDIMMPDVDGWEILQRLKNTQSVQHIPVVICSVLNDPELAFSLGAAFCLPKPVQRDYFHKALQSLGIEV